MSQYSATYTCSSYLDQKSEGRKRGTPLMVVVFCLYDELVVRWDVPLQDSLEPYTESHWS